ncbi:MAG: YfhO family protein [Anaerolineae bacterium]|nr:YfhO family protein [Anaerolineae bacterium]
MRRYQRDALALSALVLLILAFFWPLLSGRYLIPRGGGDLVSFLWPTYRFAARSLRQGVLPLWNPTLYAGMPFAADNQSGLFYPPNLLLFLIGGEPGYEAMEALVVLHMMLAGALMYLLLRDHRLSRSASVFGGLSFALSDLFVTHIGNLNLNATIAYLPGILLLADRALLRRSVGYAGAAGALLAVAALAGHGQMLAFLGMGLTVLVLYRIGCALRGGKGAVPRLVLVAMLILLTGLGGAAIALLPSYELEGYSLRGGGLSFEEASRYALPWRGLVGLIVPRFYGRGPHAFWGSWERVEVGYLGVLPLALGLAALLPRRREERGPEGFPVGFFAMVALAGVALALGDRTPLFRLGHALPLLRSLRAPARAIVLMSFGLAALGACGLDRLPASRRVRGAALLLLTAALAVTLALPHVIVVPAERAESVRRGVWLAAACCGGGLLWLAAAARWPRARWLGAAAVLLVAFDLIASGSTVEIDTGDPWQGYRHAEVVEWLRRDNGPYRIDSSAAHLWQPDAAAVHGLYDISGIHNPLGLAAYETYRWSISARGDTLYSLLGVRYVLSDKGNPPGDERLVPAYTGGSAVDVYMNTTAYPMAQLVYDAVQVPGAREAFEAIHAPGFDPTRVVILQEEPQPTGHPGAGPRSVRYTEYSANRMTLEVETPTAGYLLLSEVYYPGWQASVDGQPARVLVADYLFRAVYVPAGGSRVQLWFSPASFWIGLGLSAATWLGLGGWLLVGTLRGTRRVPAPLRV